MSISVHHNDSTNETEILIKINRLTLDSQDAYRNMFEEVRKRVVDLAVDEIVQNKMQDIITAVNPQAVANLALAKVASRIADKLSEK